MRKVAVVLTLVALVSGCAKVTTVKYGLAPKPNSCQVTEARPTKFSTQVTGVCWDRDGEVIGLTGSGGLPVISAPLEILRALAPVAASVFFGLGLKNAAETLKNVNLGGGTLEHTASPELVEQVRHGVGPFPPPD